MEGVDLEFRPEALQEVATKAMSRKTGARGLRSILEDALLDTMYELPSLVNVKKVVFDENICKEQNDPIMIFEDPPAKEAASDQ